ncbi:MAG: glycosyltransferase [Thiobacillus sp.]|nr:glycosyltransferase [Thiobacillus sp.]
MRILVTCDRYSGLPLDGLTLRIHHYAKYLSARHELDLVCLGDDTETNHEIEAFFRNVRRFPSPAPAIPGGRLSKLASGLNPATLYPHSPEVQVHLLECAGSGRYDLIWDAGCNMLFNLGALRKSVPLLADQVDDSFLRMRRELALAPSLYSKLWTLKQFALTWIFAFQHLRKAGAVLFVSQADADSFKRVMPSAHTVVVENGVDEAYFCPDSPSIPDNAPAAPEIVFEGSMFFAPNIDAVRYFVEAILPLVRKELPHARFTIVGRNPTAEVIALAGEGVEVTGSVPDIRPYLRRAGVFVCPMRSGAGIKNKILQAWAMGKAIVSTTAGVGSLKTEEGRNILIRDNPEEFAAAVIDLLCNPKRATRLGEAGRATIESHYTWAGKAGELEALMQQIVDQNHGPDRGTV